MVVVIGCTLCSYRHDAVVAIFILLKGKFLPKCIVDIHKEVGGIVKSLNGEFRSYFGCQRERFGIVRWNQQYGQCIVGQLTFIRITEEIKSFGAAELVKVTSPTFISQSVIWLVSATLPVKSGSLTLVSLCCWHAAKERLPTRNAPYKTVLFIFESFIIRNFVAKLGLLAQSRNGEN